MTEEINNDKDFVNFQITLDIKSHEGKHGKIKTLEDIINFARCLSYDITRCTACGFPEKYHQTEPENNIFLKIFNKHYLRCPKV